MPGYLRTLLVFCLWSAAAGAVDYDMVPGARGVPLQIAEAGPREAPGVLFIHGWSLSSSSWLQQFESSLADSWHLVALDLRGHGNSGKPWDRESYNDSKLWADDIAAVLDATGLEAPVVVAWSFGGHVTMDFLRHYPAERLGGVVFVGTTGGMLPFPPPDAATAEEFARLGKLAVSPNAADRMTAARGFVRGMLVAPVKQSVIDREVASTLAITPLVRKAMVGRPLDNSDLVNRLRFPVLFLLGDAERTASLDGVNSLAARIRAARVTLYEETGHMPFIERQERFNADLAEFLRMVGRAPAGEGNGK